MFSGYDREHIKIQPYNPRETDWYRYREYFDSIVSQTTWSDQTKCAKLIGSLPLNLTGVTSGMTQPITYAAIMQRLDVVHGVSSSKEDADRKLRALEKGHTESVSLFAERIRQLCQRAYPAPDYTPKARDEQALKLFVQSLPTKHDMRKSMSMQTFKSLDEAVEYGTRFEMVIKEHEPHEKGKNVGHFRKCQESDQLSSQITESLKTHLSNVLKNEVKEELHRNIQTQNVKKQNESSVSQEKKAPVKKEKKTRQNSACHGCGQLGHWKPECPDLPKNKTRTQPSAEASGSHLNS